MPDRSDNPKPDPLKPRPARDATDAPTRREVPGYHDAPLPSLRPISAKILKITTLVGIAIAAAYGWREVRPLFKQVQVDVRKFIDALLPSHYLDDPKIPPPVLPRPAPPPQPKPTPQPAPVPQPKPTPPPAPPESPKNNDSLTKIFERVNKLMNNFSFMKHLKESTLALFPQGCGGAVVARNALVTAGHCFDKNDKRKLEGVEAMIIGTDEWTFTHKPYFLKHTKRLRHVVVRHPTLDVAVVVFSQSYFLKSRVLPVAEHPVDAWAPVIHCGHPAGQLWNVKGGYVSSQNNGKYHFVAESYPGSSGGPVINEKGAVISVFTHMYNAMTYDAYGPVIDRAMIASMIRQGETELGMRAKIKPQAKSKTKRKSHAKKKPKLKKPFVFPKDRR